MKTTKTFKKITAVFVSLLMLFSVTLGAVAQDTQTAQDIATEITTALATADTVTVELKNDIADGIDLNVPEGKTVNISGGYTLNFVNIFGAGTVNISVKAIKAVNSSEALCVTDTATVNVTVTDGVYGEDVLATPANYDSTVYDDAAGVAVIIWSDSNEEYPTVTVNGNIYGGNGTLPEEAFAYGDSYCDGGYGVLIEGSAKLTVNGDVYGGNSEGNYAYGADAITYWQVEKEDTIDVTVNGNIYGGDVKADPTVEGSQSMGGNGIIMSDGNLTANITVNGNIYAGDTNGFRGIGGTALEVGNATINIEGDLYAGSASGKNGTAGSAINVWNSDVTVNGDVYGGKATGEDSKGAGVMQAEVIAEGSEIYHDEFSKIYIDGTVYVGEGEGSAAVYYFSNSIKFLPKDMLLIDYNGMIHQGATNDEIIVSAMFSSAMAAVDGVITVDDFSEIMTDFYKTMAQAIGYPLPENFAVELDAENESVLETEEIINLNAAIENADPALVLAGIDNAVGPMVELYNAAVEANYTQNTPISFEGTDITVWAIDKGNGEYAVLNPEVEFEGIKDVAAQMLKDTVKYIVRVKEAQNGTVTADVKTVKQDGKVTITATPNENYELDLITANGLEKADDYTAKVGGGIEISGTFKEKAPAPAPDNQNNQGNNQTPSTQPQAPAGGSDTSSISPPTSDDASVYILISVLSMLVVAVGASIARPLFRAKKAR